jgi:hypothetical protein
VALCYGFTCTPMLYSDEKSYIPNQTSRSLLPTNSLLQICLFLKSTPLHIPHPAMQHSSKYFKGLTFHDVSVLDYPSVNTCVCADKHGCAVHHGNAHSTHSRLTQTTPFADWLTTLGRRPLYLPKLSHCLVLLHQLCQLSTKDRPTHQLLPT